MAAASPARDTDTAIVGAGPYGLATAAFLTAAGIDHRIFGEPMDLWRDHMPAGMLLRSTSRVSSIAHPGGGLMVDDFARQRPGGISKPVRVEEFVEYGKWFQRQVAPEVDRRRVTEVEIAANGLRLTLDNGESLTARRVVVATGPSRFARRPAELASLPDALVSHSADAGELTRFAGKRVVVVGCGQSALEGAALLHEAGAEVEVAARAADIVWLAGDPPDGHLDLRRRMLPPTDVGGRVSGWLAAVPNVFRHLPAELRQLLVMRCTVPAGSDWLRPRLENVRLRTAAPIVTAEEAGGGVRLQLADGDELLADHVYLGTGYEVDLAGLGFLAPSLLAGLEMEGSSPRLGPGLESSVPGLHFVGAPAAVSFGPIMRFVGGTWFAAPAVLRRALGRPQPPLALAFPVAHQRRSA
ncbi:MAG: hypothetical protein QOJ38_294 [Solirubrobacterales bacterium]|nr:hypothetical protein [Solirubrobacterales bacterium]